MVLTICYANKANAYTLGQINITCFNRQELWADLDVHVVVVVKTDAPGQPSPLQVISTAQEFMKSSSLPDGAKKTVLNGYREKLYACRNQHWMKGDILSTTWRGIGVAAVGDGAGGRAGGIFLEATMDGYQLYRKRGWKDVYELTMNYETWGGKGVQTLMLMRKAP